MHSGVASIASVADDPKRSQRGLKSRSAAVSCRSRGVLSFRSEARRHPAVKRRKFITLLGGAAAWPVTARAQQSVMPVVGFVRDGSADTSARLAAAFRKGLNEIGYVEGQNVTVEYHWLEGQYNPFPQLIAALVPPPSP